MDVSAMPNYVITIFKNNLKVKMIYKVESIYLTIAHHHLHLYQISYLDTLTLNLWLLKKS